MLINIELLGITSGYLPSSNKPYYQVLTFNNYLSTLNYCNLPSFALGHHVLMLPMSTVHHAKNKTYSAVLVLHQSRL